MRCLSRSLALIAALSCGLVQSAPDRGPVEVLWNSTVDALSIAYGGGKVHALGSPGSGSTPSTALYTWDLDAGHERRFPVPQLGSAFASGSVEPDLGVIVLPDGDAVFRVDLWAALVPGNQTDFLSTLYRVNATSGNVLWQRSTRVRREADSNTVGVAYRAGGTDYVISIVGTRIIIVTAASGALVSDTVVAGVTYSDAVAVVAYPRGRTRAGVLVLWFGGALFAYSLQDLRAPAFLWRCTATVSTAPVVSPDQQVLYVSHDASASTSATLLQVNATNGKVIAPFELSHTPGTLAAVTDERVFFVAQSGATSYLRSLAPSTGVVANVTGASVTGWLSCGLASTGDVVVCVSSLLGAYPIPVGAILVNATTASTVARFYPEDIGVSDLSVNVLAPPIVVTAADERSFTVVVSQQSIVALRIPNW